MQSSNLVTPPITGIEFISDIARLPSHFTLIDRSFDTKEDVELWREKLFCRQKISRFLCISRLNRNNSSIVEEPQNTDVVIDVVLINERDQVPSGYVSKEFTIDTKEKAIKRKQLCVRFAPRNSSVCAIIDVIILSKQKQPPFGYVVFGVINNHTLCYKLGKIDQFESESVSVQSPPVSSSSNSVPVGIPLKYSVTSPQPVLTSETVQGSTFKTSTQNPLADVPFEINKKYAPSNLDPFLSSINVNVKSSYNINKEYDYNFSVERSVLLQTLSIE